MLDEAEGTQLEQKNSTIKTPFNKEFLKSYSGTHILQFIKNFWLLVQRKLIKENARMPPKDDNVSTLDFN